MKTVIKMAARWMHKRNYPLELQFMLACLYGSLELYGYLGCSWMVAEILKQNFDQIREEMNLWQTQKSVKPVMLSSEKPKPSAPLAASILKN